MQNSTIYNLGKDYSFSAGPVSGSLQTLQNTTIGNGDTFQNSTVYDLQNTTIGNGDTIQNSKIYNLGKDYSFSVGPVSGSLQTLQNTTIGNRDTMQNSTVYLQNTTIGDMDTIQNSTVYDLGLNVVNVSGDNDGDWSPVNCNDNNGGASCYILI